MKKVAIVAALMALLVGVGVRAADSVEPASMTFTNFRSEAVSPVPGGGTIYRHSSLLLTNCLCYTGTDTNSAIQGLDGVTVAVSVGNLSSNVDHTATLDANGTNWWLSFTVPDLSSMNVQVKVTDGSGNSYIYPNKTLTAEQSMHD